MRIEQGVKIASGSVSITEDFKENEIIVVSHINDIETAHPGYLGCQDTFYVGNLKGVGRIYQ